MPLTSVSNKSLLLLLLAHSSASLLLHTPLSQKGNRNLLVLNITCGTWQINFHSLHLNPRVQESCYVYVTRVLIAFSLSTAPKKVKIYRTLLSLLIRW
jgi:hypothetical protein